jgi:heme o synthase
MLAITKTYTSLTKPGIILGNLMTTSAGFALASHGLIDFSLLFSTLAGLCCVIASASICNNAIDRDLDKKMARTKDRALAVGRISIKNALNFASVLALVGFLLLAFYANLLTAAIALLGFLVYVFVYSPMKIRSVHATLVGSIAGATPPVIGLCAAGNQLNGAGWILFLMMALWQMPHFYAIALYRLQDYAQASIPVLPVKKSVHTTKVQMLFYTAGFVLASSLLTLYGYTGILYLVTATLLGIIWIFLCIRGFTCDNDQRWARTMFIFSLIVVTILCCIIPFSIQGY